MSARHIVAIGLYVGFLGCVSWLCFRQPVTGDLDRYIYEALVRGKNQPVEAAYGAIKHASAHAENSSVIDSATHLGQLEPLYAIKPLYVKAIEATSFTGLPIQVRVNLISAVSLFGIGMVMLGWTGKPLYSALLLATPAIVVLGRMGTPDALSSLVVIAGLWALSRDRLLAGVLMLAISVWVRTDNILFVIAALAYLLGQGKLRLADAGLVAALAAGSVAAINYFSGNYGWRVLLRFSFMSGRSPAEVDPHFTAAEYLTVAARSAGVIFPQMAIWILLGIVAWKWSSPYRGWLIPVWLAVFAHFALYPSPESRTLIWAFVATGVIFVGAIRGGGPWVGASVWGEGLGHQVL